MFFLAQLFSVALHVNVVPLLHYFNIQQDLEFTTLASHLGFWIALGVPVALYIWDRVYRGKFVRSPVASTRAWVRAFVNARENSRRDICD